MATMQLVQTTVFADSVWMRYANHADHTSATEWLDFRVPLAPLVDPHNEPAPLGDVETALVSEVRLAALRYVRDIISAETQRLAARRDR